MIMVKNKQILIARKLRKNQTPQEAKLWNILRNHQLHNLEFRRQHPIGEYIVDFICRPKKLIIELDGGQHNCPENIEYDKKRTEYLKSRGYHVLRFWNNDVDCNIDGVMMKLESTLKEL